MKTNQIFILLAVFTSVILFSACQKLSDVGTFQDATQTYNFNNFSKLQMSSAFKINVQQGNVFAISVRGDRRNLDDLRVQVESGVLKADYYPNTNKNRQYTTEFTITMPALEGVDFSGATTSDISGFAGNDLLSIRLSGASVSTFSVQPKQASINLSGASQLKLTGNAQKVNADISGASILESFSFAIEEVQVKVAGASKASINVSKVLNAEASGASHIRYVGNPATVTSNVSGASSVSKE